MKGIWPFLWLLSGAWLFLSGRQERRLFMASIGLVSMIVVGASLIPRPITTKVDMRYQSVPTTIPTTQVSTKGL